MTEASQAPASTADQPSQAAPSSTAEGGAAGGEGGGSMPLIIGGVVVVLLLVGVGAFIAMSGGKEGGSTTAKGGGPGGGGGGGGGGDDKKDNKTGGGTIDPSKWTYFGVKISDMEDTDHGVSGEAYAATENIIALKDFSYDGAGPAAFFMVGTTDTPDEKGEVVADTTKRARRSAAAAMALDPAEGASLQGGGPRAGEEKLKKYDKEKVVIKLAKPIKDYKYFSVFSKDEKKSYGHVKLDGVTVPAEQTCDAFANADHGTESSANVLLDSKRVELKDFKFDGTAPQTFVSVGKGTIDATTAKKLHDTSLPELTGKTVSYTLPGDETWDQYEWIVVYCFTANAEFGSFNLPSPLTVPVNVGTASRRRRAVQRRVRMGSPSFKSGSGARKPKELVCTFGEFGTRAAMVPPDGMCDVIFFTDVEYNSNEDTIVSKDGGPAFGVLKSAAQKYTKTTFGTSMSTGTITDAVKDKEAELKASMEELFSARLYHFGMLNVENIENYESLKRTGLKYLKFVGEFLKTKMSQGRYHAALGISLLDATKGEQILIVAKQAPHDFPGLTMIVVKLHTENVNNGGDHWPVAPNPDGVDLTDHNALTLAVIKDQVKEELMGIATHGRYGMLSFAMYARTYRMKASWNDVSVREKFESSLNMDYPAVCKMKAAKDSSDDGTMYSADKKKKFLALFDSPATFKAKTKERLNVMPKNFTGLALYNVEMDDYKNTCGKGRFPRLQAIKAALGA